MTSKLTIEQAKRLRNDFECWQQDYDPKDDKEQYDMFGRGMVAMDMLIAGMYQEPVAFINGAWTLVYYRPPKESGLKIGDKLYRHAQQPVEQDNSATTQHFDTIALETAREIMCDVNRRHEFLGGEVQLLSRIQCRIDDACRAAMLNGGQ